MRAVSTRTLLALGIALLGARAAGAQASLLPTMSYGAGVVVTGWHFATPIAQSNGSITDLQQIAVPLQAGSTNGPWSFDFTGAAVSSSLRVRGADSTTTLSLSGLTDLRARGSVRFFDDRFLATVGVNLPTGTTGLDASQTRVLEAIGSPAFRMPVASLGIGPGVTAGLTAGKQVGTWAVAVGGSAERRAEYAPIELALASGNSLTKVTPGGAMHVTLGLDGTAGDDRLSLLVVGDAYARDKVTVGLADGTTGATSYTLGPQITVVGGLETVSKDWREASASVALRYRTAFSDSAGVKVDGSSGTYADATLLGIRGGARGVGLILGAEAWYHSGMSFTDALVGSATRGASASLGIEVPSASIVSRLVVRGGFGQFALGGSSSTGAMLSAAYSISPGRSAR